MSATQVVLVGLDQTQEAEGMDRTSLLLPGEQRQLIESTVRAAGGKTVVVVVMSGSVVDLAALERDERVGAILWCGYPGQSGGAAIGDAI